MADGCAVWLWILTFVRMTGLCRGMAALPSVIPGLTRDPGPRALRCLALGPDFRQDDGAGYGLAGGGGAGSDRSIAMRPVLSGFFANALLASATAPATSGAIGGPKPDWQPR